MRLHPWYRIRIPLIVTFVIICFQPAEAFADSFSFSLLPSTGSVSGTDGSTVGWGYSVTNDSTSDWLVTTNLSADSFSNGTPQLLFDFPVVAPGETVTEALDAEKSVGLYEFTWDPSSPIGTVNSGSFVLSAQWWDADPSGGGNYIADAIDQSAVYSATLTGSTVPEPGGFLSLVLGATIFLVAKSRPSKDLRLIAKKYR